MLLPNHGALISSAYFHCTSLPFSNKAVTLSPRQCLLCYILHPLQSKSACGGKAKHKFILCYLFCRCIFACFMYRFSELYKGFNSIARGPALGKSWNDWLKHAFRICIYDICSLRLASVISGEQHVFQTLSKAANCWKKSCQSNSWSNESFQFLTTPFNCVLRSNSLSSKQPCEGMPRIKGILSWDSGDICLLLSKWQCLPSPGEASDSPQ